MYNIPLQGIVAAAAVCGVVAASATATAHVPDRCQPLFVEAGLASERVISKGGAASDTALAGLDIGRNVTIVDFEILADKLAQLLGAQTDFFTKLHAAVVCVQERHGN